MTELEISALEHINKLIKGLHSPLPQSVQYATEEWKSEKLLEYADKCTEDDTNKREASRWLKAMVINGKD